MDLYKLSYMDMLLDMVMLEMYSFFFRVNVSQSIVHKGNFCRNHRFRYLVWQFTSIEINHVNQ